MFLCDMCDMCDMCVVSDICSWEMTVIGCGVCVERCVCQDVNVCGVSICVWVYVLVHGCVCSYMSCYVCVDAWVSIGLDLFVCMLMFDCGMFVVCVCL